MSAILTLDLEDKEAAAKLEKFFGEFGKGAKQGAADTNSWATAVTGWNQALELGKKVWQAVVTVVNLAAQAVNAVVIETAAYDDALGDMAEATGIAVKQLEVLHFAAGSIGISTGSMNVGIRTLTKAMDEAQNPASKMSKTFTSLGISVLDHAGKMKTSESVMMDVATAFSTMENGAVKNALALELFGRSGGELIPLLNKGGAGVHAMGGELERLGLASSEAAAVMGGRLTDNI